MWLSQNIKFGGESRHNTAEVGSISIGGTSLAVVTQSEQRNLKMALQNGYFWRPNIGDKVLVITSDDGEGIVVGVIPTSVPELSAGELELSGNGASIKLNSSGQIKLTANKIYLSGDMSFSGDLVINGQAYVPYVAEVL